MRRDIHRWCLALAVLWAAVGAGCVLPDEFRAVDQNCESPRFDLETRDAFCSGSFGSEPVVQVSDITDAEGDRPLVRLSGPWLTTVRSLGQGDQVHVQVFKRNARGLYVNYLGSTYPVPAVSGQLTALAVMGLDLETDEPEAASIALVHDRRVLSFVPLDPGLRQSPIFRLDSDKLFAATGTRVERAAGCENQVDGPLDENGSPVPFELANIEAFRPKEHPERRFLMVSARCGVAIYGDDDVVGTAPTLLEELSLHALDLKVDVERDRVLVAAGRDGLRITPLSSLSASLNRRYEEAFAPDGAGCGVDPIWCDGVTCMNTCTAEPCACPGGNCATPVCNSDEAEAVGAPTGLFDDDAVLTIDPSERAAYNVTRVEFNDSRVYYLNEPTDPGDPYSGLTWLFAGTVDGQALTEKTAVALSSDDHQFERVSWNMVNLDGSIFALLRNTWDTTEGGEVKRTSRLSLVDAPMDVEPKIVLRVPTTAPVESIHRDGDRLLVVQQDLIHAYHFDVSGEPNK